MQEMIIQIMNQFGYVGISLLIAIENIFPPIPSEVILTFGGFMTTYTNLNTGGVIIAATIGSVLGAIVLYAVGSILKAERLIRLVEGRVGRMLHLKKEDIEKAFGWFERRGNITVLLCRCVPIVRSLISIPAGMAKMKFGQFLLLTTVGSLVWNTVLVYLGVAAGASWENIVQYMDKYSIYTLFALVAIVLIVVVIFIKKRFIDNTNK